MPGIPPGAFDNLKERLKAAFKKKSKKPVEQKPAQDAKPAGGEAATATPVTTPAVAPTGTKPAVPAPAVGHTLEADPVKPVSKPETKPEVKSEAKPEEAAPVSTAADAAPTTSVNPAVGVSDTDKSKGEAAAVAPVPAA